MAPYNGGDVIWFKTKSLKKLQCTGGFWYTGINSGKTFMLTAAHCTGLNQAVYTNTSTPRLIGDVSAIHFSTRGYDIATVPGTGIGAVYGNTTTYGVKSAGNPSTSTYVTFDGAKTGEVHTVHVISATTCVTFSDGVTTCHLFVGYKGGLLVCQGGDSGGPVYQRLPTGGVKASGIIIGVTTVTGTCFAQRIKTTLSLVTGSILTG